MATPFDATTKSLVELSPADWLAYLGLPGRDCEVVDADLATVSTEADRLIRVNHPDPYLAHIEFVAGHEGARMPLRAVRYSVLAEDKFALPVETTIILLQPRADSPQLTGVLERRWVSDGRIYHYFEYRVIRLWECPVATLLKGGLALLPLAPIADLSGMSAEDVVERLGQRFGAEAAPDMERRLWASTYILMGLRFSPEAAAQLLRGVESMKESSTYQAILEEGAALGEVRGIRDVILRQGRKRFGSPTAEQEESLQQIVSVVRLEQLAERILEVESWEELLGVS